MISSLLDLLIALREDFISEDRFFVRGLPFHMNKIFFALSLIGLQGCTVIALADAAGSAVIYAGKTVINTVDVITPDVVNKKK